MSADVGGEDDGNDLGDLNDVCLLWDIDGTLIAHSSAKRDRHAHAVSLVLSVDAHPVPAGTGKTDRQIIAEIISVHSDPEDSLVDAVLAALDEVTEADLVLNPVMPTAGVAGVLGTCAGQGVAQRVLTGNTPRRAELKIHSAGLGMHFPARNGFYGERHATRFELVAEAADVLGPEAVARTVIVGDTPLDVHAARSVGFPVISVATGSISVADLAAAGPDALLEDFSGGSADFLAALRMALRA